MICQFVLNEHQSQRRMKILLSGSKFGVICLIQLKIFLIPLFVWIRFDLISDDVGGIVYFWILRNSFRQPFVHSK